MGRDVSHFLAEGGEMGALTRAFDWSSTPLGPPEKWPQSLRVTVRLVLTSRHPMFIWWGPELIQFYNDAYRETMGPERHPSALGARGRECWEEIWDIIGPQIEYVMAGKGATWHEDQLVPLTRTSPVNNSGCPLREGCVPARMTCIVMARSSATAAGTQAISRTTRPARAVEATTIFLHVTIVRSLSCVPP
jgi:hypothetical protein